MAEAKRRKVWDFQVNRGPTRLVPLFPVRSFVPVRAALIAGRLSRGQHSCAWSVTRAARMPTWTWRSLNRILTTWRAGVPSRPGTRKEMESPAPRSASMISRRRGGLQSASKSNSGASPPSRGCIGKGERSRSRTYARWPWSRDPRLRLSAGSGVVHQATLQDPLCQGVEILQPGPIRLPGRPTANLREALIDAEVGARLKRESRIKARTVGTAGPPVPSPRDRC